MAIEDTYSEFLLEQILRELLLEGTSPTPAEILERYEDFVADNDISKPLFKLSNYEVESGEASSASKYNNSTSSILTDLKVLYNHLFKITDVSINNFERWRTESALLEGRLDDLEERINSLLLLSSDTAGFFNFIADQFVDNRFVDVANTTAMVDPKSDTVSIGVSNTGATRIDLTDLRDEDVVFTVLSRNNLVSTSSPNKSRTQYAISDLTNFWQERVFASKPGPVAIEVVVDLKQEYELSRIDVDLHMANANSSVQVTPMLSTDNYNFTQLPIANFTRSILDQSTFRFDPRTARYVKFIMTKTGYDQVSKDLYVYEFGVDQIAFFKESFSVNTEAVLISKSLSVSDENNNPEEFSRIVLEVCEDVPDGTSISYQVAALNSPTESIPSGLFIPIDPINRKDSVQPTVLDFGDLSEATVSGVQVSYNTTASVDKFINPAQDFKVIQSVTAGTAVVASGQSSNPRYSFLNSNDKILDHSVASGIQVAKGTLEVWRNVIQQGQEVTIRGYQAGWGFTEPYYKTTVYVSNPSGVEIDFGAKPVIIDETKRSGKITIDQGRHKISVHKDNWKAITNTVTDLASLKTADTLYPYNQRYLVEGFLYPSDYPADDEKIYKGFDIVAEFFMKEVSVFDMIDNVLSTDYEKFALDKDAIDTAGSIDGVPSTKESMTVFLVKVDENKSDFTNELYLMKFKVANLLFKYLKFKAILETTSPQITPILDSYRIKISS